MACELYLNKTVASKWEKKSLESVADPAQCASLNSVIFFPGQMATNNKNYIPHLCGC